MEAYVERMIEEQKNLQEKIDKLEKFINSDDCKKLSVQKQFLLELQHAIWYLIIVFLLKE